MQQRNGELRAGHPDDAGERQPSAAVTRDQPAGGDLHHRIHAALNREDPADDHDGDPLPRGVERQVRRPEPGQAVAQQNGHADARHRRGGQKRREVAEGRPSGGAAGDAPSGDQGNRRETEQRAQHEGRALTGARRDKSADRGTAQGGERCPEPEGAERPSASLGGGGVGDGSVQRGDHHASGRADGRDGDGDQRPGVADPGDAETERVGREAAEQRPAPPDRRGDHAGLEFHQPHAEAEEADHEPDPGQTEPDVCEIQGQDRQNHLPGNIDAKPGAAQRQARRAPPRFRAHRTVSVSPASDRFLWWPSPRSRHWTVHREGQICRGGVP